MRAPGGGRKRATETDPWLAPALKALVDPGARGDPESPLVWTTKSTKNLAGTLAAHGHPVSGRTVARTLCGQGFSLQGSAKVTEGRQHIDRDAQFGYLNAQVIEHRGAGGERGHQEEVAGRRDRPGDHRLPPGTSKWNKIEHRLFSQITMNWRGRPLTSHQIIVDLISATSTPLG